MPETSAAVEADLARQLRRYRAIALGCLGVAVAGLAASYAPFFPPYLIAPTRAVAEAAVVGGLADWFAVTALFRRPLGLPIPHTALVPRGRDRIADGVATYIDGEFLRPDMLIGQLRKIDPAEQVARYLHSEAGRRRTADFISRFIPGLLRQNRPAAFKDLLVTATRDALRETDLRPALARLLDHLLRSAEAETLIAQLADSGIVFVDINRDRVLSLIESGSEWWIPRWVDRKLATVLADGIRETLIELKDPRSRTGSDFRVWLATLPRRIETAEAVGARAADLLMAAANNPAFAGLIDEALATLRTALRADLLARDSKAREAIEAGVASIASQLDSQAMRDRVNQSLEEWLSHGIPAWREEIKAFIASTLRAQDVTIFARRLELRVGKDLQFIRINGTVLGALIGGVLYALHVALG